MGEQQELYMRRCIQLAKLGAGQVAPNPMVGAVLVYEDRIIGEGYHKKYGEAHAEVNCIASVKEADRKFIESSVLYVSLEPCAHYGKTPPCSDLIIRHKIPTVVIGCRDPFEQVNGKGIEKLKAAGIEVVSGILETESAELNKRFFTFHTKKRPYIILKWAQTANKKIASDSNNRLIITNKVTNRVVHKWRSEEAGILVGTNTIVADDPLLTNRLWTGNNPVRLVVDINLKLTQALKVFNPEAATVIFNGTKSTIISGMPAVNGTYYYHVNKNQNLPEQIAAGCYRLGIESILIEGGAKLLQSFIDVCLLDEARIITNKQMIIEDGLDAPVLHNMHRIHTETCSPPDEVEFSYN